MPHSVPVKPHWSTDPQGRWYRWRGYTVRWLLFGLVVNVFQPVAEDVDSLWLHKLYQAWIGLIFGAACALVFTLAENHYNTPRLKWKSWLIVLATWFGVKVAFISLIAVVD